MKPPVCTKCQKELQWGKFAYMQEVCWTCFKLEVQEIRWFLLKYYPEERLDKLKEHDDIIVHLLDCIAEIHRLDRFA